VCSAIFGFGLVGIIGLLLIATAGLFLPKVHSVTAAEAMTPQLKLWATLLMSVMAGVMLAGVYQLYRLFGNLAAGAIYTAENVRRVRSVGLLTLLWAVLGVLIPAAWTALFAFGFVDALPGNAEEFSWSLALNPFFTAALILLISWIMDVGLYEKDHADELKRDADLVI
jgi:hypothetical protein